MASQYESLRDPFIIMFSVPLAAIGVVLALLIFGPKRLPEIGRTLGRGMAEFRKASNDLKRTINVELALDEQPPPPVRPYRPNTQLDALRAPRHPDGSPAVALDSPAPDALDRIPSPEDPEDPESTPGQPA
jgi:TatA/E family protein of Tat protein translocase